MRKRLDSFPATPHFSPVCPPLSYGFVAMRVTTS